MKLGTAWVSMPVLGLVTTSTSWTTTRLVVTRLVVGIRPGVIASLHRSQQSSNRSQIPCPGSPAGRLHSSSPRSPGRPSCCQMTRCGISKIKNLVPRAQNSLWGPLPRGYVCLWGPDVELAKKKNLVPRAQNSLWGPVSRGYVGLWGPDVELEKKKNLVPRAQNSLWGPHMGPDGTIWE